MRMRIVNRLLSIFLLLAVSVSFFPAVKPVGLNESNPGQPMEPFELKLFSDKPVYKTTERINIWATLKYVGNKTGIRIWHGDPGIVFGISDEKDFNLEGMRFTILTSSYVKRNKLYTYNYKKSGSYDENDPKAEFWRNFYSEKDLFLPEGEYRIRAMGTFSLSIESINEIRVSDSITIRVEK